MSDNTDGRLRIDQLASVHGIDRRAIEHFEDVGLLKPNRDELGSFYSLRDEVRLRIILKAQALGFDENLIAQILSVAKWG